MKGKQLYGYFKRQPRQIAHKKTWTRLRDRNLTRETEFYLIAGKNNAIRIHYINAENDNTTE